MTHCTVRVGGRKGPHECGRPAERIYLYRGDRYPKCHRCNNREVKRQAELDNIESVPA